MMVPWDVQTRGGRFRRSVTGVQSCDSVAAACRHVDISNMAISRVWQVAAVLQLSVSEVPGIAPGLRVQSLDSVMRLSKEAGIKLKSRT